MELYKLCLKPIEDSDIEMLSKWLNKDYILKWYNDADEWLNEVRKRKNAFSFLNHYVVYMQDIAIGFCQYYDCFDAQEEWYSIEIPNKVYSIDYLIGEEAYLGKGYGKTIVQSLVEKIIDEKSPDAIIVSPDAENTASCKALLANGFVYDTEKEYYILKFI